MMDASIIIPAWNETGTIEDTLSALERLCITCDAELIFIAGGDDGTYNLCREWSNDKFNREICLRQQDSDGKSGALKKGIAEARGEHLLFLDADTLVPENWLCRVLQELESVDAVSCNYEPREPHWIVSAHTLVRKWYSMAKDEHGLGGWATIGIRGDILEEIGREKFFTDTGEGADDTHFQRVLQAHDQNIGIVQDVVVQTSFPTTLRQFNDDLLRWHTARYDLEKNRRKMIINQFSRSSAVVGSPFLSVLYFCGLEVVSYFGILIMVLFIVKILRRTIIASQISGKAIALTPQYTIAEYIYHFTRVNAYFQRFFGFRGEVHHF